MGGMRRRTPDTPAWMKYFIRRTEARARGDYSANDKESGPATNRYQKEGY